MFASGLEPTCSLPNDSKTMIPGMETKKGARGARRGCVDGISVVSSFNLEILCKSRNYAIAVDY